MNKKSILFMLTQLLAGSSFLSAAWQVEKRALSPKKERVSSSFGLRPADKPVSDGAAAMEDLTGTRILADDKGKKSSLHFGFNRMSVPGPETDAPERFVVADPGAKSPGICLNDKKCGAAEILSCSTQAPGGRTRSRSPDLSRELRIFSPEESTPAKLFLLIQPQVRGPGFSSVTETNH